MDPLSYLNLPADINLPNQPVDDLTSWLNADFTVADSPDPRDSVATPPELFPNLPLFSSAPSPSESSNTNNPAGASVALVSLLQQNPSLANLLAIISAPSQPAAVVPVSTTASKAPAKPAPVRKTPEERTPDEQDKRRRNTLASARFRQKKKLKEQELERTTKDMSLRVDFLEQKVKEHEMEIKWLRSVVTERDGAKKLREIYAESGLVLTEGVFAASAEQPSRIQDNMMYQY